jgi:hypothetical protein
VQDTCSRLPYIYKKGQKRPRKRENTTMATTIGFSKGKRILLASSKIGMHQSRIQKRCLLAYFKYYSNSTTYKTTQRQMQNAGGYHSIHLRKRHNPETRKTTPEHNTQPLPTITHFFVPNIRTRTVQSHTVQTRMCTTPVRGHTYNNLRDRLKTSLIQVERLNVI